MAMIVWCDRLLCFLLCLLIFVVAAAPAAVSLLGGVALLCFLMKKVFAAYAAFGTTIDCPAERKAVLSKALRLKFHSPVLEWICAAFVVATACSLPLSYYPELSYSAFLAKTLFTVFFFIMIQEALQTPVRVCWFAGLFFLSAVILCLDGFWQLAGNPDIFKHLVVTDGRLKASMKHPNDLGAYLIFVALPMAVMAIQSYRVFLRKRGMVAALTAAGWIIGALLVLYGLGLTYSRSAWLGAVAGVVVFLFLERKFWKPFFWAGAAFLLLFLPMIRQREDLFSPGKTLIDGLMNNNGRFAYWPIGWEIFTDHPVFGTGLNTYTMVVKEYSRLFQNYPHNSFLQTAAETGILGAGTLVAFLAAVMVVSWSRIRKVADHDVRALLFAFLAAWCGVLVESFFDTTFYSTQLRTVLWMTAGFLIVAPAVFQSRESGIKD